MSGELLQPDLFGLVTFQPVSLSEANVCLRNWGHKMGPLHRGNQGAVCHALIHEGRPVGVTTASNLICARVGGGCRTLTRENTIELSRLCAERSGLCRVVLRLWREFAFPAMGYQNAISYRLALP